MEWWLILIIILAVIVAITLLILIFTSQARKSRKLEAKKEKAFADYDNLLQGLKATGYCFISEQKLLTMYTPEELKENKFTKRPFVCFCSPQLGKAKHVIVIPQVTNHKTKHYWNNMYVDNGSHYLNTERTTFIEPQYLWFRSKKWLESNGYLNEINQRIDEVKEFIKNYLWSNGITAD